jgi:L-threonylcarbamoyladenylate synthase
MAHIIRLVVDPARPDATVVERAAAVVRAGGVVAVPTDTLYGLAADPFNAEAVRRVFAIKERAPDQALPLIAADVEQIAEHLAPLPPLGLRLASCFWPGPLTLIVRPRAPLPREVTAGTGVVGVRVPDQAVARMLCARSERPLTATSANISGHAGPADPADLAAAIGERVDVLLDAGRTRGGPPSTIVDITASDPRLVRAGAIPWEQVEACLRG